MSGSSMSASQPAEMRRKFAAIKRWQWFSKLVTLVTLIIVAVMFYVFQKNTRDDVQANFESTRTQAAINKVLPDVQPAVSTAIQTVMQDVAPEYRQMAAQRFEKIRPVIGQKAVARFQKIPDEATDLLAKKLRASFDSVLAKIEPDIKGSMPSLNDPAKREELVKHFHEAIEARNAKIVAKFDSVRTAEETRMKAILDKFALPADEMGPNNEQLQKQLISTLLLLAQEQVEAWDTSTPGAGPSLEKGK